MTNNLVPQFILENYANHVHNGRFRAGGLFVDISGFSALTDQLMAHGQHGTEVLAGVMRNVFEPLIEAVYGQAGFVTGFAGDAFTAVFPDTDSHSASRALAAAVAIQQRMQSLSEQDTPYGRFILSAKVGIATGEVIWGIVSAEDELQATYYFQGTAIEDSAEAERVALPGEVILTSAAQEAVRERVTAEAREGHFKLATVTGPLPEPRAYDLPDANVEQLSRFVPGEALRAGRTGEFRQVVNMFISLPTVRTEAQLDIFVKTVFRLQRRYGGLLTQLDFGDKGAKLLLFWGAPVAQENDVQRALHFILDLQTQTTIPINGGLTYRVAHAGSIGSSMRSEYTCYGRGVNLAARFMTGAPRGEIWVDEHIARRAGPQFDLEFEGLKSFKGFVEPQKVYILFERTELSESLDDVRLVGRDTELKQLAEFVAPIYENQSPGMLVVWGEPGAGKSRLALEFLAHHLRPDLEKQVFLAQTDEIVRQSLNPFRYWLRRYFGQSEGLAASRNKRSFNRKLDTLIGETDNERLAEQLDQLRSFLGALVGLTWPDSSYRQAEAKERQEHTLSALMALLHAESLQQPVVLFLEDAHWLDQDSAAFLSTLIGYLMGQEGAPFPLAILATARYESDHNPLENIAYHAMDLSALDRAGLEALAIAHLDGSPASDLLDLLVERSEGNPFFAEQIVRYLRESRQLQKADGHWQLAALERSPLPEDVNALLVARLDRLTYAVRKVVQTAAVLGREFETRVLSAMLQDDAALAEKISQAERASIWSAMNEIRYIFKHALLRDAAYRMQLHARRQALHRLALEALESVFKDELTGRYGELAYHSLSAGLPGPAFKYGLLAGNQAMDHYAAAEAVDHYQAATSLLGQVTTDAKQRHQLCLRYGRALELTGDPAAALAHYESMEILARDLGDQPLELSSIVAQGTLRSTGNVMNDFALAEALSQKGLDLASTLNDPAQEAKIHWNMIHAYRLVGRNQEALSSGLRAYDLAETFELREQMAYIANDLNTVYMGAGEISRMRINAERAVELWRELGNQPMLADGLATYGMTLAFTGHLDQALTVSEEGIALCQATNNQWGEAFMRYTPTLVHLQRMEIELGLANSQIAMPLARDAGATIVQFYTGLFLSLLYLAAGDYEETLASANQTQELASRHFPYQKRAAQGIMAIAHIELGELGLAGELLSNYEIDPDNLGFLLTLLPELAKCWYLAAISDYVGALSITRKVTAFTEEQGITVIAPQFYLIQAQANLALAHSDAARTSLQSGTSLLRKTGGRWGQTELNRLIAQLEKAHNS